jgi:hypothetical protein
MREGPRLAKLLALEVFTAEIQFKKAKRIGEGSFNEARPALGSNWDGHDGNAVAKILYASGN